MKPIVGILFFYNLTLYAYSQILNPPTSDPIVFKNTSIYTSLWNPYSHIPTHKFPCTIEYKPDLSDEEFTIHYHQRRPVIFNRHNLNSNFRQSCTKDFLLTHYGTYEIILSTANSYSYDKQRITLKDYINNLKSQEIEIDGDKTLYMFGDHTSDFEGLLNEYNPPKFTVTPTPSLSWGIAGDGSGVPFHVHGAVFAEVLYGRKLWFLYPPHKKPSFDPNKTTLNWVMNQYHKLSEDQKPLQCIVESEQVLYIPSDWLHSTLNLGETVFISAFV